MRKTKNTLKKIESKGEEIANFVSHTAGAGLAILFQSLFYWILFSYPFYIEDSLFLTLIEFFWEPNSIKINRYMTRFLLFFHLFP